MKERQRTRDKGKKKDLRALGEKAKGGKETKRLVPKSHSNRPYFNAANPGRRNGSPMYHSESINYSRAGIGVVFRDADSSARALQELAQRRQERAERKRAAMLIGLLMAMAVSVHLFTRPQPIPLVQPAYEKKVDETINYGGDSSLESLKVDKKSDATISKGSSNATRGDSIWNHLTDSIDDFGNFTPFFFHVPRNGGQTIKDIVGLCLEKVQASEVGIREGHQDDKELQTVTIDNIKYINVDTSSKEGIERAAVMGFEQQQMAEMVTSSYFLNVAKYLFSAERQGRAFILLRHPIDRAVSMFHYQKSVGALGEKLSLEDYARGNGIENNWIVRFLTNAMEGELKKSHLDQAKKILSKKFLVGFLDDADESLTRMMKYNGWTYSEDETKGLMQQDCVKKHVTEGSNSNPNEYEMPRKGSQSHALLSWQTQYDIKLYEFAKQLFEIQTKQYGSKERKKEIKKKEKAKTKAKEKL
mmetsp:Transcript_17414/g.26347  ORF Transcript_17414/g.26347 Transcript_17414/m.26347 type:complete len:473 (-) Transcript_17414:1225-2643(-)|eukprot:CAMPEP_0194209386 /NCGR_PEP_ID=MMETSP0156-20130528/7532_1 /TAXON_ID=33649 /ORGANISM="Thalassionema nitzschioides, Strain L26-B" /LENGTH=472 /DNA_ID=CAMNT_0038936553 /DNA_START=12 /DNA_END=1430 /DNA_ORIENTATION=-